MSKVSSNFNLGDYIINKKTHCNVCRNEFDFVGVVKGKISLDSLRRVYPNHVISDEVFVVGRESKNNGKALVANVEVIVECPKCNAKNKTREHFVIWETKE